jgi:hypothetical protein
MAIPNEILEKPGPLTEQFDPLVVSVFADVIADRGAPRVALAS